MKKYIYAILLVLFFIDCDSQKNVSNLLKEAARNRDTICFDNYYCCFMDTCWTITPKQDTVKVLMLVCDTSMEDFTPIDTIEISSGKVLGSGFIPYYNNSVQWQFGYAITEAINSQLWLPSYYVEYSTSGFPYITREYLDQNKKPISKKLGSLDD